MDSPPNPTHAAYCVPHPHPFPLCLPASPPPPLCAAQLELQLWASQRGQLLARTVHGMMLNETALKVLARLEHPKPPSWSELEYK